MADDKKMTKKLPDGSKAHGTQETAPMKITINRAELERLTAHALKCRPEEACGLVAGTDRADGVREIRKVVLMTNTDHSCEHFAIDPREQLSAIREIRREGLRPLGNWHSHPASPARPSEEDIRLANDPKASYLILSLAGDHPVLCAFHIGPGADGTRQVRKEDLTVTDAPVPEVTVPRPET